MLFKQNTNPRTGEMTQQLEHLLPWQRTWVCFPVSMSDRIWYLRVQHIWRHLLVSGWTWIHVHTEMHVNKNKILKKQQKQNNRSTTWLYILFFFKIYSHSNHLQHLALVIFAFSMLNCSVMMSLFKTLTPLRSYVRDHSYHSFILLIFYWCMKIWWGKSSDCFIHFHLGCNFFSVTLDFLFVCEFGQQTFILLCVLQRFSARLSLVTWFFLNSFFLKADLSNSSELHLIDYAFHGL